MFRPTDLARAMKTARANGYDVLRTEIRPDGRFVLVHHGDMPPRIESALDEWRARKYAR